jgi:hypothetical protein
MFRVIRPDFEEIKEGRILNKIELQISFLTLKLISYSDIF